MSVRRHVLILLFLVLPPGAFAQSTDLTDVVRAAKARAIADGVKVDQDECARFEITKRAALMLVQQGAGLYEKLSGNNCQGRSVDIIAFKDGTLVDIIGSGPDGPNTPHWMVLAEKGDPSRWRAPFEVAAPSAPVEPPATVDDHDQALRHIETQLEAIRMELQTLVQSGDENTERIQKQIDQVVKNAERSTAPLFLKILSLGLAK